MPKTTKRLKEEVAELDEYVIRNERNIKKLKELYERAVDINKHFTDRIKAMKKEIFDLERGMYDIRELRETCHSWVDEESVINKNTSLKRLKRLKSKIY